MILLVSLATTLAQAGTKHYYYTDAQGTVLAKADAQGNIIATYDYAPYGVQVMGVPPSGPAGYTGHVSDVESGFVYMQARYYDPAVGRFLSVDPLSPAQGNLSNFNRYDYANDDPINHIDPDGRDSLWVRGARHTTIVIPVHFVGEGATSKNINDIIMMSKHLDVLNRAYSISVVSTDSAINGQLNKMDLSHGYDFKKYGDAGEGLIKMGGDSWHINTSNVGWKRAALHDIMHFASFPEGYRANGKGDKRVVTGYLTGYDNDNIMANRSGNIITPDEIRRADDYGDRQRTNRSCTLAGSEGTMSCD
jgi:RHS repeat-associated protein